MSFDIFASYSHQDGRFVKPLVKFLLPAGAPVFRDEDSIPPGTRWAAEIQAALQGCRVVYVFWCQHSQASEEVGKEYREAIALNKSVVPVLMDDTPLPAALADFEWVDLRLVIGPHQQVVQQRMSLAEGQDWQKLDREAHGYKRGEDGYFAGEFWRRGWKQVGDEYVRQLTVPMDVPEAALQQAAHLLQAHHVQRFGQPPH